jgi:hypothetical protein
MSSGGERSLGGCTMLVCEALAARGWIRGGDAQPGLGLRSGRMTREAPEEESLRRRGFGS